MATDIKLKVENKKKMEYAYKEIRKFLKDEFNLTPTIPYSENNRLRKTFARFLCRVHTTRLNGRKVDVMTNYRIEYNSKFLAVADYDQVAAVGKHEALHYALRYLGRPSNDGSTEFEYYLRKYNLPSHTDSRTIESVSALYHEKQREKHRHYAECPKCHQLVAEWLRTPDLKVLDRKTTTCCREKPTYLGKMTPNEVKLKYNL